jgi:hypothetical protein
MAVIMVVTGVEAIRVASTLLPLMRVEAKWKGNE